MARGQRRAGQGDGGGASSVNFKSLLNQRASDVTKPPPLPAGTWLATAEKYVMGRSRRKKTPQVEIPFSLTGPGPDIDTDALGDVKWEGKKLTNTFYITDDAAYRLADFFKGLGFDVENKSLQELLEELPGTDVMLTVEHRDSDDPESDAVYPEITDVVAAG